MPRMNWQGGLEDMQGGLDNMRACIVELRRGA